MITKSSRIFIVSLSLVSLFFLAVLIFGIYDIRAKNKKTSLLLSEIDRTSETGALAQSIKIIKTNTGEDLATFDEIVFTEEKLVPLIENIELTGRTFGLEAKTVSVSKIEDKKKVEPDLVRIILETHGGWAETLSFLRAIESLPHRVIIDDSSISKTELNWRLRMTLDIHLFE